MVILLCPCLCILDPVLSSAAVSYHTPKPHIFRHCSRDSPEKESKSVFMEFSFIFLVNCCFRMITNFQISWRALQRTWLYPKPHESKLPTEMPHLSPVLECVFPRNKNIFKNIHSIAIYIRGYRCYIVIVWLSDNPCDFASHRGKEGAAQHQVEHLLASLGLQQSSVFLDFSDCALWRIMNLLFHSMSQLWPMISCFHFHWFLLWI